MGHTFELPDRTRAPLNNEAAGQGSSNHNNNKKKKDKKSKVVKDWEVYMGDDSLQENWARFLHDLGLGDFKSKTQCKKALRNKWVNIRDFLTLVKQRNAAAESIVDQEAREAAVKAPVEAHFFSSERALAEYTVASHKVYPRKAILKDSPLRLLLARIL